MHWISFISGLLILLCLVFEIFWTTLGEGGGPLTNRITQLLWHLLRSHPIPHRLLSFFGIQIVLAVIAIWICLLWLGWLLVFWGSTEAVINSQTRLPADFGARVYFTGFTIFTLGTGDYVPQGSFWQVLTAIASLSGLFLITFTITYLVPVVQAAAHKRMVALTLFSLGSTPQAILANTWNGRDWSTLEQHLTTLMPELATLKQHYVTYPVLNYFNASNSSEVISLRLAALDEVLTILAYGLKEGEQCFPHGLLHPTRQLLSSCLQVMARAYALKHPQKIPPSPNLSILADHGMPVITQKQFQCNLAQLEKRRALWLALIQETGWSWLKQQPHTHI
ncbi:potassium channel family protein [Nitrosococcus wardiae]|uniref:Two pore domain potassium channel family protein n=1 Tax=Nitrosococcus wardiae TaxID=1814290 RepID=A0A4P7BZU3_9GAMM|nr:potassium channel family protein [Nitrosococcus wardiae]QBQ54062.1 two pore domain potassium channel family protein [Nitrosococcus wardiae]